MSASKAQNNKIEGIMQEIERLLIFLSLTTQTVFSQNFEWAKQIGGSVSDYGRSIAVDAQGNVYTTGNFWGTVDFNPGAGIFNLSSPGGFDIFISKLSASGNFLWAKQIGGTIDDGGLSIALGAKGNVYTMGYFEGIVDFDPGAGTYNLNSAGNVNIFISKFDSLGNFVWAKQLDGTYGKRGKFIVTDTQENVYVTGFFEGTVDFDPGPGMFNLTSAGAEDIFISKLDALGNFLWAKRMGGGLGADQGYSITVDAQGHVYTTGFFGGTVDFDPSVAGIYNLTSLGSTWDIFISKLSTSGNFMWAKRMGGMGSDYGSSITVDAQGKVYTIGRFEVTADFDPGAGTYNLVSAGSGDIFLSKLDSLGNLHWAKKTGGTGNDYGQSVAIDAQGNSYATGYFSGTADFNPGTGTYNLVSAGLSDIFLSKLDSLGNLHWAKSMGGTGNDYGQSVAIDAQQNVYTTGDFAGTADFDPSASVFNQISAGSWDIFVSKLTCNATSGIVVNACDNFVSPSGKYTWFSSGIYSDTIANKAGCDSIITFDLTVHNLPQIIFNNPDSVCLNGGIVSLSATPPGGNFIGTGINSYSFDPQVAGIGWHLVAYTYKDTNNCTNSATDSIYVDGCTGTKPVNHSINSITLHPNPASGMFMLSFGRSGERRVVVYNALGEVVKEVVSMDGTAISLNLNGRPNGMYFAVVRENNEPSLLIKVVKE